MDSHPEGKTSYRVEVSGWDASEDFFVEKTELEGNRNDIKEIVLRSLVREPRGRLRPLLFVNAYPRPLCKIGRGGGNGDAARG